MLLEVCFDDRPGLQRALDGGARRFEVCSRLDQDGLSPSDELLAAAVATGVECVAMVRPRGGAHVWSAAEHAGLLEDIERVRRMGARAVVLGAITDDRRVDGALVARLVRAASPLPVVFHRAFDGVRDRFEALETLVDLGVRRILTSGGAPDAFTGRFELRALIERAAGRIAILPGGGVRGHDAAEILAATGATELHSSTPFEMPKQG
jgi:copper homeostasis protein